MPLQPYLRGATWWAKGKIECNGRPISEYIRESTGASDESGARDWINEREDRAIKAYLVGEEHVFTFADAVMLYKPEPQMAKYLIPLLKELGSKPVRTITAEMIRDLGPKLYPENATDSWRRWVVTPARAVLNKAHALHPALCPHFRIENYDNGTRIKQDRARGKRSRVAKTPGDWDWLLKFRAHANRQNRALALFMFTTGARVGQAVAMHPEKHLRLDQNTAIIPGAKGHEDREVTLSPEMVAELRELRPRVPRDWERKPSNLRVFGYASRTGPLKNWRHACKEAKIEYLSPHAAGRHGFGQEMRVRQGVDTKAVERVGGWSAKGGMVDKIYTHAEDSDGKVLKALRTGRVQAEKRTGLKVAGMLGTQA